MGKKLSLLDRFSAAADILTRGTFTMPVSEWKSNYYFGASTNSGIAVNEVTAQRYSAVFACVRLYEWVTASLPMKITRTEGNTLVEIKEGEIFDLLNYPNRFQNIYQFNALMNARLQLHGNALAIIKTDKSGRAVELVPVEWSSVNVRLVNGEPVYVVDDKETGIKGTFLYWEVIHYKINSRNGWVGLSPLTVARESIGHGLAIEQFGSGFFKKGGNLKGALETDGHLSDKEFSAWKNRWEKYYGGAVGDHTTPVLEYGMKYKQIGVAPNDAQFIESGIFRITDVARFFGVTPSIIGENTKNAFTSAEQQAIDFVRYSLSPLCKNQVAELEFKLMNRDERGKNDIVFDLDYLLKGDMVTRARYLQVMVTTGIFTRNEARAVEGKSPLEGLDEPLDPAFITGKQGLTNDKEKDNE